MEELPYPTVKHYLSWVRNRMTVSFRRLEQQKVGVHRVKIISRKVA